MTIRVIGNYKKKIGVLIPIGNLGSSIENALVDHIIATDATPRETALVHRARGRFVRPTLECFRVDRLASRR
jgi:hypothetical protein